MRRETGRNKIGQNRKKSFEKEKKVRDPVVKDTNKTRRKMVKPTKGGRKSCEY